MKIAARDPFIQNQTQNSDPMVEGKPGKRVDGKNLTKSDSKAETVAKEFEALFLDLMLKSMRKTASPETESNAEGIYKSMLDSEYAKNMASNRSFGIKELILDWMQKQHPQALESNAGQADSIQSTKMQGAAAQLEEASALSIPELHSKMAMEIYKMQSKAGMK
jgi:flagellar protein FlgJ